MKGYATLLWLLLTGTVGFALFHITFKVEQLEARLSELNGRILAEQRNVHVLRAEWSHLNNPQRLQRLADALLPHLQAQQSAQFVDADELPPRGAEEMPAAPGVPVAAAPTPIPARTMR